MPARDPHAGPVHDAARHADAEARRRGPVEVFDATRRSGLDGWTMALARYELMRDHVLGMLDDESDDDGTVLL